MTHTQGEDPNSPQLERSVFVSSQTLSRDTSRFPSVLPEGELDTTGILWDLYLRCRVNRRRHFLRTLLKDP